MANFKKCRKSKQRTFFSKRSKLAQTSIEFVFTMALAMMLLVPATIVFNKYVSDSQNALVNSQVHKIGSELIHLSEKMYASGIAWETIEIILPGAVRNITVYNDSEMSEMVISYETDALTEVVFFTPIQLYNETGRNCDSTVGGCRIIISPGETEIRIESHLGDKVIINPRNN